MTDMFRMILAFRMTLAFRMILGAGLVSGALALVACDSPAVPIAPTVADLPGPFAAGTLDLAFENANGTYSATVRHPLSDAGAPYPAVAYSPGLGSQKEFNAEVGAHLATHGYVVITFTVPNPMGAIVEKIDGLGSALDLIVAEGQNPASPLFGMVDGTRRVVMGHSQGAEAALQFAARDPSLAAVVAQAPSIGFFSRDPIDTITAPTLLQTATEDGLVPFGVSVSAYETTLRRPKHLVVIQGGNHVGFNDVGSIPVLVAVMLGIDRPPTISPADQRLLARRSEVAWLEFHTKGRSHFRLLIDGPRIERDVSVGLLQDARAEL